jgi:hypothetical protein
MIAASKNPRLVRVICVSKAWATILCAQDYTRSVFHALASAMQAQAEMQL